MIPCCPKCGNTTFSLERLDVKKSNYQLFGVCCAHCGAVIGIQEYYNIGVLIRNFAKKLNVDLD